MKKVPAYEATDGTLHRDKTGAVTASIEYLFKTESTYRRENITFDTVARFIIENHSKISTILSHLDEPNDDDDEGMRATFMYAT